MNNKWEQHLLSYPDIVEEIHGILVASKLLDYKVNIRIMQDKDSFGICFDFNNEQQELHLDIFFNKDETLKEICTCRGNCRSCCSSNWDNNYFSPIKQIKENL